MYSSLIEDVPDDLNSLSSATIIDDVGDIEIGELTINEGGIIYVKGSGMISVILQYGPSGDGISSSDSYPFSFEVNLSIKDEELIIQEILLLTVDTSSFYE